MAVAFVIYVIRYITNIRLPYVTDDRTALLDLLIIGFIMCCVGILFNLSSFNWANVCVVLEDVVGTASLFIMAAVVFKFIRFEKNKLLFYVMQEVLLK